MNTVIVGGGLSGLLLTHQLHKAGDKVTLIESREVLGGSLRRPALTMIPATNENMEVLEWARAHAPLALNFEVKEHRPEIFDEARWRPFAGFGQSDFQSIGELSALSQTNEVAITPGADQLVRALIDQLPISATLKCEVTEVKVGDGKVTEVIVNGEKSIKCDRLIYTGAPQNMNTLIQGEALPAKHRTRLAKMYSWTAVVLELDGQPSMGDHSGMLLFQHSGKDFEPVFGRVDAHGSRWATLVHSERHEEHEFTGQCIRHIKRQLKRAWPDLFADEKKTEKIYVLPGAYGQNSLKSKSGWHFPEIENLYFANHTLARQGGLLGALEAAASVDALLFSETSLTTDTSQFETT